MILKIAIAAFIFWVIWRWWTSQKAARPTMDVAEAYAVLGLPGTASAEEIRAAHRRIIAQVHPDKGGSADLTARVNGARDLLLDRLNRNDAEAS
jgi:DnaJ-class molecular chaperone